MPEMTKQEPDPEDTGTMQETTTSCQDSGEVHSPVSVMTPGSRRWFWAKRTENLALWLAPAVPLAMGIFQLIAPLMTLSVDEDQSVSLTEVYEMRSGGASTVEQVTVFLNNPGIADRLLAAAPALLFGVLLTFVSYALWRIEINLSATGKYTAKDEHILDRAIGWMWRGWCVLFAAEMVVNFWFRDASGSGHWWLHSASAPFGHASLITLMVAGVLGIVARIYRNGARAYAELEKGV